MRPSKVAVICYSFTLITIGIFISKFLFFMNTLDDDVSYVIKNTSDRYKVIGGDYSNIQWIVQISDLHLSTFRDPDRISELATFCGTALDAIKPRVVLATGDLTDGRSPNNREFTEYEEEWRAYRDVLKNNSVTNKTVWLDIRGNHDNINVLSINSANNYFREYSVQGREHPRSYFYISQMDNGEKIGFIAVDLCLTVGLKLQYNFAGKLTDEEEQSIRKFVQQARDYDVKYLFWFGHYPTSTVQYPGSKVLREIIANEKTSVAFFSGHFHQVGGLAPKMYSYQKEGFFELELADWKSNRIIRVMAIDHGQFSFVDEKHGEWPIIFVTNPKTAILVPPVKYSFIPFSSHIRLLVFSPFPVTKVKLKIDNGDWRECIHVNESFYVIPWNQNEYQNGLHTITVEAEDEKENKRQITHNFSLDGSRLDRKFSARFFLMPNLGVFCQFLFTSSVLLCVVPLLIFRYLVSIYKVEAEEITTIKCGCLMRLFRKFCILCDMNRFFYPLVLYPIYLLFGPWLIAYMVDDKIGVLFSWGIIIDGGYEPSWNLTSFGWKQGVMHLFLIFHSANEVDKKFSRVINKQNYSSDFSIIRCLSLVWDNFFYTFFISFQILQTLFFWYSIGFLSLVIGPLTSWWLILALWIKSEIIYLSEDKILRLGQKWRPAL
ncbi:transmembrane protein 62-like [Planococcus citri]|uniref:transmembrane protein 62-like n=1 Tax=Planococcus citri TaxID=170843 RepID=UPI0031F7B865